MYEASGLVRVAKREQNKKRNYLIINRLQGKHIPVSPAQALAMFEALAEKLKGDITAEQTLLIGFAETATAIGAAAAIKLGTYYMQTTREDVPGAQYLVFSEEHSHAAMQRLVTNGLEAILQKIRQIVFIEDEVTTGNTILNMISVLEKAYPCRVSYAVASILNGMDNEARKRYEERGIRLYDLVKTDNAAYPKQAEQYTQEGSYILSGSLPHKNIHPLEYTVSGFLDARRLLDARAYEKACLHLWKDVQKQLPEPLTGSVLVLGTEEFMYPALYCASLIEQAGADVRFHATTRSPIAVFQEAQYPLHIRYELPSLYEKGRRTFIYEIGAYSHVLIFTDARQKEREGIDALVQAAAVYNEKISVVWWEASV
ncbi:MAG: phosphoribosyltransferase family protein [Eubacterium sp.]|nr:phosphoribosyltransferase family protein [Eubacterium sp.]